MSNLGRAGREGGCQVPDGWSSVYFNESEHPFVIDCFLRQE